MRQPILTAAALMAKLTAAIHASPAIADWVTDTYGPSARLTLQAGKDLTDPDTAAAAPLVMLTPLPRPLSSKGATPGAINTSVAVAFILEAATETTTVDSGSSTLSALEITHAGIARAEAMAALLVDVMDAASTAVKLAFDNLEIDEITSWPYINGGFSVTAWPLRFDSTTGIVTL